MTKNQWPQTKSYVTDHEFVLVSPKNGLLLAVQREGPNDPQVTQIMQDIADHLNQGVQTSMSEDLGPWPGALRAVNYRVGEYGNGAPIWAHRIEQYHKGEWTAVRVYEENEDGTLEEIGR
jgi:hypothetical protein